MNKWPKRAVVKLQMLLWRAVARDMMSALARPEDPPLAHAEGVSRTRVLLVGSAGAMGWGVRSHDLGLPGVLARAVAAATGRGVEVDLVAEPNMTPKEVVAAVGAAGPHRFDAVVVTVGFHSAVALQSTRAWERDIHAMLEGLRALLGNEGALVVSGIPVPRLDGVPLWVAREVREHARALDLVTRSLLRRPREQFAPVHLPVEEFDFLAHAAAGYEDWGFGLGSVLAPMMREPIRHDEWAELRLEGARQASVDRLMREGAMTSPAVQRIVDMTRSALGAESASFTVLDGDTERHLTRAGGESFEIPREQSLCQHAIMEPAGMVVEDVLADSRFHDNPRAASKESPLRFYAGFPVESPEGYPVGALCIVDSRPRRASDVNTVLLREFALLIQRELWGQHVTRG